MMGSKKRSLQSDFLAGIHMIGILAVNLLRAVSLKNLTSRFKEQRNKSDIYLFKIKKAALLVKTFYMKLSCQIHSFKFGPVGMFWKVPC